MRIFFGHWFLWNCCLLNGVLTVHVPKKGNAYLDGTVHVGKEVQTIQRYKLEPYMWEKRYKPVTGTIHVGKCFPILTYWKVHTNILKWKYYPSWNHFFYFRYTKIRPSKSLTNLQQEGLIFSDKLVPLLTITMQSTRRFKSMSSLQ